MIAPISALDMFSTNFRISRFCRSDGRRADQLEQRILLLRCGPGSLSGWSPLAGRIGRSSRRNLLLAAAVAMPVGDQVVRNAVQPGRKRHAAIGVVDDVVHRPLENTRCQVFGIVHVARPVVHVVEDAIHITLIELTEGIAVAL
ncbi:MAG: hypothetical protein MZV64_17745 [Ignavibacteriales bacterium]|nr:hypothetical protein [Ignavibacteriales bacterium]